MAWIESHQTLKNHPKTLMLCDILSIARPAAIGHLHLLWWWCIDYAPSGELSRFSDTQIAMASEWPGNAKDYVTALRTSGFLNKTKVHDWDEFTLHYNLSLEKKDRQRDQVRERVKRWRNANVTQRNGVETPSNAPTVPDPTVPNQPNHKKSVRVIFVKPTVPEIAAYSISIFAEVDPQQFFDHYESNGWRVGRNPMRDWKATVRTWKKRKNDFKPAAAVCAPRLPPPPPPLKELSDEDQAAALDALKAFKSTRRMRSKP